MKEFFLDNGIKVIYEYREGSITSFCIGFNGGALEENGFSLGTAHALEHMVFKGTTSRTEAQINGELDDYFGFYNAMTNYPYVIYYGTLNSDDFHKGFELYCDILLNPSFPMEGFKEEMDVIRQEIIEWREDPVQRCEDILFFNAFKTRRLKELIIGNEQSINNITLDELKVYYGKYYCPDNCVISVVTSLTLEDAYKGINNLFGKWHRNFEKLDSAYYEANEKGICTSKENIEGCKIQYIYDISNFTKEEIAALNVFNALFGEGTSSILYSEVRTKRGMAYEVGSCIKNERGIKLFKIELSTSKANIENAIEVINQSIKDFKENYVLTEEEVSSVGKRLKLKKALALEKSIELCKKITTYTLMYGDYKYVYDEIDVSNISANDVLKVVKNKLINPTIQVLM